MSRDFSRTDRISAQLRRELSVLVHELVREHGIPSVSVSDVEVTRDLAHASVFVTAFDPTTADSAVAQLNDAAKEMRHMLSKRVGFRTVPVLKFKYDDSVDRGERIDSLLRDSGPSE